MQYVFEYHNHRFSTGDTIEGAMQKYSKVELLKHDRLLAMIEYNIINDNTVPTLGQAAIIPIIVYM